MLALEARLRYTGEPFAVFVRYLISMAEPAQSPTDPPNKPSSAMGYLWIFAGIAVIAALLTMSLFIAGM